MAWHDDCEHGRRLLDSYLMALTNVDTVRKAAYSGDATAREARTAKESVVAARSQYWRHVEHHKCRTAVA
jgi:hypothetical protein